MLLDYFHAGYDTSFHLLSSQYFFQKNYATVITTRVAEDQAQLAQKMKHTQHRQLQ